jgi:arylsulfatase A-like enzyme
VRERVLSSGADRVSAAARGPRRAAEEMRMRFRAVRVRLAAVLLSGLVLGTLGLLEPLLRFWSHFHQLGISGTRLLLYYLGIGVAIAIVAGIPVTLALSRRSVQWLPVAIAAYYATATAALTGAIALAPILRWEITGFRMNLSYAILFPTLLAIATLLVYKGTPRIVVPVFAWLFGHPSGRVARLRLGVILALIGLLIPITLLKGAQSRFRADGRPAQTELATRPSADPLQNVLLITVDALRADHLQCYGYARATSPRIDRLAAEGVRFSHAFAQSNCTELSLGSLYTSLYPSMHGVQRRAGTASRLSQPIETLAEQMRDAGLQTYGLMTNPYLKREWGLTQGYDQIDEFRSGYRGLLPVRILHELHMIELPELIAHLDVPRAKTVVDDAIRVLESTHGHPFFLHLHFMDVHHPYIPPEPYQEMFKTPGASALSAARLWYRSWSVFQMLPSDQPLLPESDLLRIKDLYDGAIRYTDDEIGRLLDELARLGLAENTLVVFTADHGDEFLEHGDIFHKTPALYDELIHVPLIVRGPGLATNRNVDSIVRHIDLLPTLLDLFGLPPLAAAQGRSLRPLLTGEAGWTELPAFSQSYEYVSVRTPEHKLMYDLRRDTSYCFDLATDPGEQTNVYGTDPQCAVLDPVLLEFLKRVTLPPEAQSPIEIDARTQNALRSLGYVDF